MYQESDIVVLKYSYVFAVVESSTKAKIGTTT